MTLRKFLILRRPRSGRLEGRTVTVQPITGFATIPQRGRGNTLSGLAQPEALPDLNEGGGQCLDIGVAVQWRRGQPQPLGAARHGRVVDWLNINLVLAE